MQIVINLAAQTLSLLDGQQQLIKRYPVSTAAAGIGEQQGSMQTPRGLHQIRARIGEGLPVGAVLRGRRFTGEIHTPELGLQYPQRDWILSRILWLSGCQPGFNRLGQVDSMRRYIYIHGTPDDQPMGVPASHGCVRMRNADVVELFDQVSTGTQVLILEHDSADEDQYVAPVPASLTRDLVGRLAAVSLSMPDSPVQIATAGLAQAWALWLGDGKLLAVAQLQPGAGLLLWQTKLFVAIDWSILLSVAEKAAITQRWRELRIVALPAIYPATNDCGFECIRTVSNGGILLRKYL